MPYTPPASIYNSNLTPSQVDRGADLSWLSQYPHEREILFSPLMGQQALATRVRGGTLIVEMRLNLNMQSLTLEEVVSKRRKVVRDMVANVSADFERGLGEAWRMLDVAAPGSAEPLVKGQRTMVTRLLPTFLTRKLKAKESTLPILEGGEEPLPDLSILKQAHTFLDSVLEPLHSHDPEYYNNDAKLGSAINDAVFRSTAVRGWAAGLAALAELCGRGKAELLSMDSLDLSDKTMSESVRDGIGMLLCLGKLQALTLRKAKGLGATGAKRLALELAVAPHLVEIECAAQHLKPASP